MASDPAIASAILNPRTALNDPWVKYGRGPGAGGRGAPRSSRRVADRCVVAVIGVPRSAGCQRTDGERLRIHHGQGPMQIRLRNRKLRYRRLRKRSTESFARMSGRSRLADTAPRPGLCHRPRTCPAANTPARGRALAGSDRTTDETDSSGAWIRTRTNRIQNPVGCQLPYAGPPSEPVSPDRVTQPRYRSSGSNA